MAEPHTGQVSVTKPVEIVVHARRPGRIELESSGALAVYLTVTMLLVVGSGFDTVALAVFVALAGATLAVAGRTESATGAVPAAAILALILVASGFTEPGSATAGDTRLLVVFGGGLSVLFAAAGYAAQGRTTSSTFLRRPAARAPTPCSCTIMSGSLSI